MLVHYGLPAFNVTPDRRLDYIDALSLADDGVTLDDLFHADVCSPQTAALQPLVEFMAEALIAELDVLTDEEPLAE